MQNSTDRDRLVPAFEEKSDRISIRAFLTPDRLKLFVECAKNAPPEPKQEPKPEIKPEAKTDADKAAENKGTANGPTQVEPNPVPAPPLPPLNVSDLTDLLKKHVPEKMLAPEILKSITHDLNECRPPEVRRISQGQPAIPGRDGKTLLLIKKFESRGPGSREQVDPRYARRFDNIEPGMIIGRVYPPTAGTDGIDALGQKISAPAGVPKEAKFDQTIAARPADNGHHFLTLVANGYGYLEAQGDQLSIKGELVIPSDIDFRVGDVDFVGSIIVKGSVMKGFHVFARGNITVDHDVIGGKLRSLTGSITVKGDIIGDVTDVVTAADQSTGMVSRLSKLHALPDQIIAAGSVQAYLVEDSSISAGKDIIITKEARASMLHARRRLLIPEGHIVSGHVSAVCGVEAKSIGSVAGARTSILLCSDIECSSHFADLRCQIRAHDTVERITELFLGPYVENPALIKSLHPLKQKQVEKTRQKLMKIKESKKSLLEERQKLLAQGSYNRTLRVNYQEAIYQGTEIIVGDNLFRISQDSKGPGTLEFQMETQQYILGELKPLECDEKHRAD